MLPKIQKILYCTDLSENSDYACRYAIYMARQTGAEIYVLYVAEKPSPDALVTLETYVKDFAGREAFIKQRLSQARETLNRQLQHYLETVSDDEKPGAERIKSIHVCESHPVEEILDNSAPYIHRDYVGDPPLALGKSRSRRQCEAP